LGWSGVLLGLLKPATPALASLGSLSAIFLPLEETSEPSNYLIR
jgi:hypothetical protein